MWSGNQHQAPSLPWSKDQAWLQATIVIRLHQILRLYRKVSHPIVCCRMSYDFPWLIFQQQYSISLAALNELQPYLHFTIYHNIEFLRVSSEHGAGFDHRERLDLT